jgi:hypothetical protein
MRILLASFVLNDHTGAELYLRDLARAFRRKGHEVVLYAVAPGTLAEEMADEGFQILRSLRGAAPPDIIHAQHQPALLEALRCFPATRAVYVIHDAISPFDEPFGFHRVLRHIAVDKRCMGRIEASGEHRRELFLNFADMDRFVSRPALPDTPRRALVFSNYWKSESEIAALRAACDSLGIALDLVGRGVGGQSRSPEHLLRNYDIVFAKGRAAIESMAVGSAVILCDFIGLGGLVTSARFDHLRAWNFGVSVLTQDITAAAISAELALYDAADAARVSRRIRAEAGLDQAADRLLDLYADLSGEVVDRDTREQRACLALHARRWRMARMAGRVQPRLRRLTSGRVGGALYRSGRALWRALGSPGEVTAEQPAGPRSAVREGQSEPR